MQLEKIGDAYIVLTGAFHNKAFLTFVPEKARIILVRIVQLHVWLRPGTNLKTALYGNAPSGGLGNHCPVNLSTPPLLMQVETIGGVLDRIQSRATSPLREIKSFFSNALI